MTRVSSPEAENTVSSTRIAVTGANGFVGAGTASYLHQLRNIEVLGLTRRATEQNFPTATWQPADHEGTRRILAGVDGVIHCAGLAHSRTAGPDAYTRANRDLALNIARDAAAAGATRFVFVSSIGVNGSTTDGIPFDENSHPSPNGTYAVAKLQAEDALKRLGSEAGLEIVVVRPPLVYGPGAPGNFGKLLQAVKRGVPLPLGMVRSNRRSYVALENLASFLHLAAVHPTAVGETFLVCDGEDLTTSDLVQRIGHAVGRPARILPVPLGALRLVGRSFGKADQVERLVGDLQVNSEKARSLLGWEPLISVDEQLARIR